MTRYLISDHHFGHPNIIEYCDRPFTSVGEMNSVMLDRFYETVGPEDTLLHFGDIAMDMRDGKETIERFEQLDGDLLIRGNHDVGLSEDEAPFPVVESCVIACDGYEFYCTHRPEDIPDWWDGWAIHGHMHNNDIETYPFVATDVKRINVGVELLDYRPVRLEGLVELIEACDGQTRLQDATEAATVIKDDT